MAKLLGILPDQLIRHTEEEEKHARFRFWLKLLPLAILAAVGGLFAWDSTRTVRNYYADYVDSYGLPEGIFPLKKTEIGHRYIHYRFEYRGFQFGDSPHADSADWCIWKLFGLRRRLVRVVQANSHGYPRTWDHSQYSDRPQIQDFKYDRDQRLCEIRCGRYNGEGREPYLEKRIELSNEAGVVNGLLQFFSNEGRLNKVYEMVSTTGTGDSLLMSKSEIVQQVLKRNLKGRVRQRLFLNSSGTNIPDGDGLYGFGYEYDDLGRQTAQWYLFRDGSEFLRHPNKKGVAGVKYEYREHNTRKIEYVNQTGSPVMGPHGWMVLECDFDANDNVITARTYDENGKRADRNDGYAELRMEYDTHGNMTRRQYFGVDGTPTLDKVFGVAEIRDEYDARGNLTKQSYFDENGKPTLNKVGCAGCVVGYDKRGRATRWLWLGVDGKKTQIKDGYAEVCNEFDANGNLTKQSYLDADGMLTLCKDGYAEWRAEYDKSGRETRDIWLGVDGKPIFTKDGIAEVRREYDKRGNIKRESFFGVDGKLSLHKDGYAELLREYNDSGNLTRIQCLGVDGKPVLNKYGFAEVRRAYDTRGNLIREQYFDVDGNPKQDTGRVRPLAYLVDVRGEVTILRDGIKYKVRLSCELLNSGDELEFSGGAKGKVIYEHAFYDIADSIRRYRVALHGLIGIDFSGNVNQIEPQFTTRGVDMGNGEGDAFVITPVKMLAQVIPPTIREGDTEVVVCTPRGACYDASLMICITGDPKVKYYVSALDMERAVMGETIELCGSSHGSGKALFDSPPEEENIYFIKVTHDGKTVNEVSSSNFWLIGGDDRKKIDNALLPVKSLMSETAKDFFTANVLYANGCHSEAYQLARKLYDAEKENMLYANLLKLCSRALNLKPERSAK